jgi:class 3 adenylate cyclase
MFRYISPNIFFFKKDIPNVNQLSAKLAPAKFLAAVTAIQERVSRVIKSHGSLFMVETSDIHLWVVASGLMSDRAIEEAVVEKRASTAEHAGHVSIGKASEEGEEEGEEGEGDESSVTVVKSKSSGIAESSVPPKQLALAVVACVLELMNLDFSDIPALAEANESVKLRIGIHSGAAVGGLVGKKVPVYALNGDAVSTAYGLCTQGQAGRVLVSEASNKLFAGEVEVEETAASVKINVSCFFLFLLFL